MGAQTRGDRGGPRCWEAECSRVLVELATEGSVKLDIQALSTSSGELLFKVYTSGNSEVSSSTGTGK